MDTAIAISLLLVALGVKFTLNAIALMRSKEVSAIEESITFYEKVAPITKSGSRRFAFALGLATYCLALVEYVSPRHPPFTGRWAWLYSAMHQAFGSNGVVLLFVIGGTMILYASAKPPSTNGPAL